MSAVTLIDGRSGSGKTSLAEELATAMGLASGTRPQILGMDELYPGWDGLSEGSASLPGVLRSASYRRYDWARERFGERIVLDPLRPLIVEGCGSITAESVAAAREWGGADGTGRGPVRTRPLHTVWIECPEPLRRERALARDGEAFAPHWDAWAAQEERHFALARPLSLARETVHAE